jgi:PAT family acetyl-CoA transporter-like MFS transporter 1
MPATPSTPVAISSSLDSIFISPRTPVARTPRHLQNGIDEADELELRLLGDEERRQAATGLDEEDYTYKRSISAKDKRAMVLLCVLCESNDAAVILI